MQPVKECVRLAQVTGGEVAPRLGHPQRGAYFPGAAGGNAEVVLAIPATAFGPFGEVQDNGRRGAPKLTGEKRRAEEMTNCMGFPFRMFMSCGDFIILLDVLKESCIILQTNVFDKQHQEF